MRKILQLKKWATFELHSFPSRFTLFFPSPKYPIPREQNHRSCGFFFVLFCVWFLFRSNCFITITFASAVCFSDRCCIVIPSKWDFFFFFWLGNKADKSKTTGARRNLWDFWWTGLRARLRAARLPGCTSRTASAAAALCLLLRNKPRADVLSSCIRGLGSNKLLGTEARKESG